MVLALNHMFLTPIIDPKSSADRIQVHKVHLFIYSRMKSDNRDHVAKRGDKVSEWGTLSYCFLTLLCWYICLKKNSYTSERGIPDEAVKCLEKAIENSQ